MELHPEIETRKEIDHQMKESADRFIEESFMLQDEKYGTLFTYEKTDEKAMEKLNPDYLAYHNSWHTRGVMRSAEHVVNVLRASGMEISERTHELIRVACAGHDLVQNWKAEKTPDGGLLRKTDRVNNENKTADYIAEYLEGVNKTEQTEVFTLREIEAVGKAVRGTIPDFDPQAKTVVQRALTDQSDILERVLALADLGDAGIWGPERFLDGGKRLFRELNLDIAGAYVEYVSDIEKEGMLKRMLVWIKSQESFARGRRDVFESELGILTENSKKALRTVFGEFYNSISVAGTQAEKFAVLAESLDVSVNQRFEQSLKFFGYKIEDKEGNGWILP